MSTPKLIDATPFEPIVIKTHFDGFDWEKLKPICEDLIRTTKIKTPLEQGDAVSSAPNQTRWPHKIKAFSDFYQFIDPICQHILLNEWSLNRAFEYGVSNFWVNVHNKGGYTKMHRHGPTVLTMAAYLQLPPNGGYIQFLDPLENIKAYHMKNEDEEHFNWKTVKAETGDVIIFPGWVLHRTEPNQSDDQRWVLTTNYMSTHVMDVQKLRNLKPVL